MPNPVVTVKPMDIPSDYAALGVVSGYSPKPAEELNFFVGGPSGQGKTTWLSSIPQTLIFDFEKGADAIPGSIPGRVHIQNYEHYQAIRTKLLADAKSNKFVFRRVGIDTGDEWMDMIAQHLSAAHNVEDITEYGGKGHGWGLIRNRCWRDIQELQLAGYSWVVLGHLTEKTITKPGTLQDITVIRPVLFDSLAKRIIRNADFHATVWRSITQEQEKEVKVLGDGRKVEIPKKEVTTVKKWFFDVRTIDGREGKERGVPTMKECIELPLIGGWGAFVKEYDKAVNEVKNNNYQKGDNN